jgi:protein-L-isoaspartate O-methyltransferase
VFVPRIIGCSPAADDGRKEGFVLDAEHDERRWLEHVYSDRVLMVVKQDDPERFSSSSMPSVMLRFLRLLQVEDANTVLEIGTGTGYNAALLSERVGAERVASVDVDEELVAAAAQALAACGYAPTLVAGDGYGGYPGRAPYDRIVATCSVPRIPPAWTAQLRPAGVLVAPLTCNLLVALRRQPDGRLLSTLPSDSADFMALRSPASPARGWAPLADQADWQVVPEPENWIAASPVQLQARLLHGDLSYAFEDGEWGVASPADGSWARLVRADDGRFWLGQAGNRRLWDEYLGAARTWVELGRPGRERYGLTVEVDGRQRVWLDEPDSGSGWELP